MTRRPAAVLHTCPQKRGRRARASVGKHWRHENQLIAFECIEVMRRSAANAYGSDEEEQDKRGASANGDLPAQRSSTGLSEQRAQAQRQAEAQAGRSNTTGHSQTGTSPSHGFGFDDAIDGNDDDDDAEEGMAGKHYDRHDGGIGDRQRGTVAAGRGGSENRGSTSSSPPTSSRTKAKKIQSTAASSSGIGSSLAAAAAAAAAADSRSGQR